MFWLNFSIWVFFLAPPFLKSLQVSFVWRSTHILLPPQNIGLFSHFLFHFFFIVQPKTILLFRFIFFYLGGYQSIWRFSNRKPYFLQFLFFLFFFCIIQLICQSFLLSKRPGTKITKSQDWKKYLKGRRRLFFSSSVS